jgi:Lectin C-type domain
MWRGSRSLQRRNRGVALATQREVRIRVMLLCFMAGCSFDGVGIDVALDPDASGAPAPSSDAGAPACPPGYAAAGTPSAGCYRFVPDFKKWMQAERICEADGAGAHLLVIDDPAEYEAILEVMHGREDEAWVGGSDEAVEGRFVTVTGAPFFVEWQPGAPDDSGDGPDGQAEDCALLESHATELEGFNDDDCNNKHSFFCEYDGMAVR